MPMTAMHETEFYKDSPMETTMDDLLANWIKLVTEWGADSPSGAPLNAIARYSALVPILQFVKSVS